MLSFSLTRLISCQTDKGEDTGQYFSSNKEVEDWQQLMKDIDTVDDSVDVQLQIAKVENTDFNLSIIMKMYGESWIVSPLEKNYPYGNMSISLNKNEYFKAEGKIIENPMSTLLKNKGWDMPYKVVNGDITFTQKFHLASNEDFEVDGEIFFVLEPICKANQMNFKVMNKSGHLSVELQ